MIEPQHPGISVARQCALVGLARSSYYAPPQEAVESPQNLALMRLIDQAYLDHPFFGSRQMARWLIRDGHLVNRKRVQRLMQLMGLQATVPGPHTSRPHPERRIYPYLLGHMTIDQPNLVWSTDITYVPMRRGFMYLVAVIDWFSRYVLSWRLSNTLDTLFCIEALQAALQHGVPVVFNTDQGSQFTSTEFTNCLLEQQILISMDGRGRALDNVFIERLWRTVKYEEIYLYDHADGVALHQGLDRYFRFYNTERPHSALGGKTPEQVHQTHGGTTHRH